MAELTGQIQEYSCCSFCGKVNTRSVAYSRTNGIYLHDECVELYGYLYSEENTSPLSLKTEIVYDASDYL